MKNKTMNVLGSKAFKMTAGAALVVLASASMVSCGGGGGGSGSSLPPGIGLVESAAQVTPSDAALDSYRLTREDVTSILQAGVAAASLRGVNGTFAVVDRVGNVLAVYATDGNDGLNGSASCTGLTTNDDAFFTNGEILISGGRTSVTSGLDNKKPCLPRGVYAISKAVTGAYLSSSGNAFSTRTASLIVQEHFYPGEADTPAGPLFGVQFSQLPCGDLVRDIGQDGPAGPKRSPLGLSADPGGFPLYKNGVVVGGIGFIKAGGTYGLDLNPRDLDNDDEEIIAYSASRAGAGYTAPDSIRGNRISGGGVFLLYSDTDGNAQTSTPSLLDGNFKNVSGYYTTAPTINAGTAYGERTSGYRKMAAGDLGTGSAEITEIEARLISRGAFVLSGPNTDNSVMPPVTTYPNRYSPKASVTPANLISALDVARMLDKAYEIAFRGRAQIRTPVGSAIQVTISVVDAAGTVLGIVRTPDAPVFGTDVSLQKARSAMFMSSNLTAQIGSIPPDYKNVDQFTTLTKFDGSVAYSARGFGNFARPLYPDGLGSATTKGPFSKTFSQWSPFSTGLQLDLSLNQILGSITTTGRATTTTCAPSSALPAQNGLQIFPGGFPIYSGNTLVGGIGISGDGIDQDDMISFLGVENARRAGANIKHAPASIRIDKKAFDAGYSARYVNCPNKPFNDSDETNPCQGI